MTISFSQIPSTLRVPGTFVEFDASRATRGTPLKAHKLLLLGQKTSAGSWTALTPQRIRSVSEAIAGGGAGSMLHAMAEAFVANNVQTETWVVPFDDPTGAAATGGYTIAGTATSPGTIAFLIAGRRVPISVLTTSTPTSIAADLVAAIAADTRHPVTAGNSSGVVTTTAKHEGVVGNEIDLRHSYYANEALPAGITVTVTPMSGGTGDVDLSTLWAKIAALQFDTICVPWSDAANLNLLDAELLTRWGPLRQSEGVAITASSKSFANVATLGASRNGAFVVIVPSYKFPNPTWEVAAAAAGQIGAAAENDPARPFNTLPLNGILAPALADRFSRTDNDQLLHTGIATLRVDASDVVRIERVVSTYQRNAIGTADTAFLDANTVYTLGFLRYDLRTLFESRYGRHKLADDGTRFGSGQAVITPASARAEIVSRFSAWEELGLVEDADAFRETLVVERNSGDPSRLDVQLAPNLINGLQVLALQVQFVN